MPQNLLLVAQEFLTLLQCAIEVAADDLLSDLQDNGGRARNGIHEVSDQFVKFLLIEAFVVREHVKHLNDEVDPLRRAVGLLLGHYIAFAKDARLVLENELRLLAAIEDDGLIDDGLLSRLQNDFERHFPIPIRRPKSGYGSTVLYITRDAGFR